VVKQENVEDEEAALDAIEDDHTDFTTIYDNDDGDEDEEDEIVREMDVYLTTQLSHQLHLLQFPLQPTPATTTTMNKEPLPLEARYKPHHNLLELDQAIPFDKMEQQGLQYLERRTYQSHTVPVSTHMAIGKIVVVQNEDEDDDDDERLAFHLTPLQHITQLRPTFTHIDAMDPQSMDNIDEEDQVAVAAAAAAAAEKERKPVMFQKKESERAAMARKSSYAYKKASEDGEGFIHLTVMGLDYPPPPLPLLHDPNGINYNDSDVDDEEKVRSILRALRNQIMCPEALRHTSILNTKVHENELIDALVMPDDGIVRSGAEATTTTTLQQQQQQRALPSLASYVRSMDYLPCGGGTYDRGPVDLVSVKDNASNNNHSNTDSPYLVDWKQTGWNKMIKVELSAIAAHVTTLLCGGWPIPFKILQQSLPPTVPPKDLLMALNACAVMVRGNFVLQSRLLQLPKSVSKARTFMLLLLQTMGIIHRTRLDYALGLKKSLGHHGGGGVKKEDNNTMETEDDDGADNRNDDHVIPLPDDDLTCESVQMLLEQIAEKTPDGWVLKLQDDTAMLTKYPATTELHMQYWGRQMLRFPDQLRRYAQQVA